MPRKRDTTREDVNDPSHAPLRCSPALPRPLPPSRSLIGAGNAGRGARRRQADAGFYRYKVGDIEVTVVTDGVNRFKLPDNFVTNVKPEEVKDALAAAHIDRETLQQHLHADRREHRRQAGADRHRHG